MPARSVAQQIDDYIRRRAPRSPLIGQGAMFERVARETGVSPLFLASIAGAETSFGTAGRAAQIKNPYGWGPGRAFSTWEAATRAVATGLRDNYLGEGLRSIREIGQKYAPVGAGNDPTGLNNHWTNNVQTHFRALGGGALTWSSAAPGNVPGSAAPGSEPGVSAGGGTIGAEPSSAPDLSGAVLEGLSSSSRGRFDPFAGLEALTAAVASAPPSVSEEPGQTPATSEQPATALPGAVQDWQQWVSVPTPRGRTSEPHRQEVLAFVGQLGADLGRRLTVFDNTTHSRTTVNGRVSAHGEGWAADIAATGDQLREIGYQALRRAGMPEAQARKARKKGGLFNVNGYQIIFATNIGGNHWDHVHVAPPRRG